MTWVQAVASCRGAGQSIDSTAGGASTPLSVQAPIGLLTSMYFLLHNPNGQCGAADDIRSHQMTWVQAVASSRGAGAEKVAQV